MKLFRTTPALVTYACGRRVEALDDTVGETIVAELPKHRHGLRSLIAAMATSELLRSR